MTNSQHNNHDSNKESREGSEYPDEKNSRFCELKYADSFLMKYSIGKIPELEDSDGHVEAKEIETLNISKSDAGLCPNAMMIHFILAGAASTAMMYSWKFEI